MGERQRFGWRVAAPGGRWPDDEISGLRSRVIGNLVRVVGYGYGCGPVAVPEHLHRGPDGRDLGPENGCNEDSTWCCPYLDTEKAIIKGRPGTG
jgi:hypothetical protein